MFHRPGSVIGGTLDRPRNKKLSGVQSKEQLQQELKSKEALINIMKVKRVKAVCTKNSILYVILIA